MVTAEPTLSPAELGLDAKRLSYLDAHLQRYVDEGRLAGTLVLVARRGEIGHFAAAGLADIARKTPMKRDTIFRIYSMSKPITSIALMQLYERGLMQIDDPVEKYIPEFAGLRVYTMGTHPAFMTRPTNRAMTVRDLLSHQSGLTYGFLARTNVDAAYRELEVDAGGKPRTLKGMIDALASLPLEFSPGESWNYSVATDVCGYLVDVISGQRFDDYLQANIFGPLGMVDTGFHVPAAKQPRLAANYSVSAAGTLRLESTGGIAPLNLVDDPATSTYLKPPTYLSGGGGLVSTATDYFRFAQALCNEGEFEGTRIIGRKTLELMTSNHLPGGADLMHHALGRWAETTFSGIGFGLGFSVTLDPAQAQISGTPGEFAWGGAASTAFWVDPIEGLVVVFMTQLMPSTQYNIRRELRSIVYSALTD
ncbi:MAG: beta-lactamase family protein [Dehalococcoidia bacterium]|nr:beta-lactamase family protein [Dehalococcoidia bacterium]